jgi:hypothetical protein
MAKWRMMLSRKSAGTAAGHTEPGSVVSAERTRISKGYSNPRRIRYETRVEGPQGWRSSFMSL